MARAVECTVSGAIAVDVGAGGRDHRAALLSRARERGAHDRAGVASERIGVARAVECTVSGAIAIDVRAGGRDHRAALVGGARRHVAAGGHRGIHVGTRSRGAGRQLAVGRVANRFPGSIPAGGLVDAAAREGTGCGASARETRRQITVGGVTMSDGTGAIDRGAALGQFWDANATAAVPLT